MRSSVSAKYAAGGPHRAADCRRACGGRRCPTPTIPRNPPHGKSVRVRSAARAGPGRPGDGPRAAGAADPAGAGGGKRDRPGCLPPGRSHRHAQGPERGDRQHRRRRPRDPVRRADLRQRAEARPGAGLRHPHRCRTHRAGPGPAGTVQQR
ncbi:hypothetical protein G6F32_015698 [Rhizopus arrhizus]|nr:hypothetical protein G6F32_015698 [Rhizopus arrhizus]